MEKHQERMIIFPWTFLFVFVCVFAHDIGEKGDGKTPGIIIMLDKHAMFV